MKKLLLLLILILPLSGCYNYLEINDMAIVEAIGIDYIDNKYTVSAQILDIDQSKIENPIIFKESDETIGKALRKISLKAPNELYFGHLALIIIGKDMAKQDITTSFEIFLRDPLIRTDSYILIAPSDNAYDILNQKINSSVFPTDAIVNSLKISSKNEGITNDLLFDELVSTTLKKGIDPTIPTVYIETVESNDQTISKNSNIKLGNLAALKDNKLNYLLNTNESTIFNIINNNFDDIMISINYQDSINNIDISRPNSNIDIKIKNNVKIVIAIKVDGDVTELKKHSDAEKKNVLEDLEDVLNKKLEKDTKDLLKTLKDKNIDILGLKNLIYKHYNDEYNKYKNTNIYEIADIEVKVESEIYEVGNTYEGLK